MRLRVAVAIALALGCASVPAAPGLGAQERALSVSLVGRVVDGANGTPLLGAFVSQHNSDRGTLTDEEGSFILPGVFPGVRSIAVEQLGYTTLVLTLVVGEDNDPLEVSMSPNPVLLEGIKVVMDRFESRRRATAVSSRVFDREDLVNAPAFDAVDFIESRTFLNTYPCPPGHFYSECALVRGRVRPVTVYVDEMPFWDGLSYLRTFQPFELHRVEVYGGGRHIRVYTAAFMERAGRIRLQPIPIFW
jgi:hypothetical protein